MSESKKELSYGESKVLSEIIYNWLKSQFNDLRYESISNKGLCRSFVKETAGYIDRKYVSGSYMAIQPFSIYLFTDGTDTRTLIDATKALTEICDWIDQQNKAKAFPELTGTDAVMSVEIDSSPYMAERNDSEYVYHMVFSVQYFHKQ